MTFTIPPLWCGVIATVCAELLTVIVASIINTRKNKNKNKMFRK